MDIADLAVELASDPKGLGYAPLVYAAKDQDIADLLNAKVGNGPEGIAAKSMTHDAFLLAIRPAYLTLSGKADAVRDKWDRILNAINGSIIVVIDDGTLALLASAVEDGVLTQDQSDATWHRTGSRAEILFRADTVITADQVGAAR